METPEQELKIRENIHRADCFTGAICALDLAVEAEKEPGYARYLDTVIREFLVEENRKAQAAHEDYLVEVFRGSLG